VNGARHVADVIVVGAGSAGATAARRLVDRGLDVLLLEAGGEDTNPAIHDVGRAWELWNAEEDWAYSTTAQEHAAGQRMPWPRGRVLGGSSSLNAAIWVRGAPADYDHWAYLGNAGWRWTDVVEVFRRIEDSDLDPGDGTPPGPLKVLTRYEIAPIQRSIVEAAQQTGIPFNANYNGDAQDGVAYMHLNIHEGRRQSTAVAYLRPVMEEPGLTVVTGARVRRLVIDGSRCTGVEWERDGQIGRATAGSEVIVCAGTIGSPQILMLSGIGRAAELRAVGIDVVVDLPGVGRNLHDHVISPMIFAAEREIAAPGPGATPGQSHLFWRSRSGLPGPDLQPIHFGVPLYEEWMDGPANGFTLMAGMIRPMSRGSIRLSGPDPSDELLIDPRTFSSVSDLDRLQAAAELCREIGAAPALREWGARELYPGPGVTSADELRGYLRSNVLTYHHQAGTCKMGIDEEAVVDPELRVYGVDGLRVADASIMPAVISGNTNAPSVMIGERVADFVAPGLVGAREAQAGAIAAS
jgi:choline dehydrogenase-like flavoprotein